MRAAHSWYRPKVIKMLENSVYIGLYIIEIYNNGKKRNQYYYIFYHKRYKMFRIYDFLINDKWY